MTTPSPGPFDDQGDPVRARRFARMWTWLALGQLGLAVIVSFAWWSAQVNGLTGGPAASFRAGQVFPWYVVAPVGAVGLYSAVRAVRTWARYRSLR
ncbi:hypothetical protein GCM10009718_35750 [Isoptericola halotolerans]|uniref:Uncharacterized protein n=1 Tax=Isoptericola halotolerans TaxID=300560 RepID=A0ABX2A5M9_9MICO|nr:hypothetical protein [Isoptericola halotolerans]NOV97220.1 hypothetical protein [Isoptericola halotolerans]